MSWYEETTTVRDSEHPVPSPKVALLVHHHNRVEVHALEEGTPLVVGRTVEADVQIPEGGISRRHARFQHTGDDIWVEDLGSTNGTVVNGRRVQRAPLQVGDTIALDTVTLSLIQVVDAPRGPVAEAASHDQFIEHLRRAVQVRSGSAVAVVMMRALEGTLHTRDWWRLREALGPDAVLGAYSADIVEVFVPTDSHSELAAALGEVIRGGVSVGCGLAVYPDAARSVDELLEASRLALRRCSIADPLQWAPSKRRRWNTEAMPKVGSRGVVIHGLAMSSVYRTVQQVAKSSIPVLLFGETGTGKEVIAHAIHEESDRAAKPFLCTNCGALTEQLVESTLFGHERGAFTGAVKQTKGLFEEADGGTVLLDEIGELSPGAQAALLRVLETKRITRVGSTREIAVDVRILGATHRDLETMCSEGRFRQDLLYRLNTMTIRIPPLRRRTDEIEPLAQQFLGEANSSTTTPASGIAPEALALLRQHDWPGNIRELRNVIDRAVVLAGGSIVGVEHLPERLRGRRAPQIESPLPRRPRSATLAAGLPIDAISAAATGERADEPDPRGVGESELPFKERVQRVERALIAEALRQTEGNKAAAARHLRIPLRTLKSKVRSYEIDSDEADPAGVASALRDLQAFAGRRAGDEAGTFKQRIRHFEAALIAEALRAAAGNKTAAAEALAIPLRTLKDKVRSYRLDEL